MIFNRKPVHGGITITIYRQGFVLVNIIDKKRDLLFRKMIGSVIIKVIPYHIRKSIGLSPSTHKMI